jgi:hypothetical protein
VHSLSEDLPIVLKSIDPPYVQSTMGKRCFVVGKVWLFDCELRYKSLRCIGASFLFWLVIVLIVGLVIKKLMKV